MNSEVRSIEVSTEHILAAIELSLKSMRLINDDEVVISYDLQTNGLNKINLKKEVSN